MTDLMPALEQHTDSLLATAGSLRDLEHDSYCDGLDPRATSSPTSPATGTAWSTSSAPPSTAPPLTMYASQEARDADIEAGARKPIETLLRDLETTCRRAPRPRWAGWARSTPTSMASEPPAGRAFRAGRSRTCGCGRSSTTTSTSTRGSPSPTSSPSCSAMFLDREVTQLARNPEAPPMAARQRRGRHLRRRGRAADHGGRAPGPGSCSGWPASCRRVVPVATRLPELPRGA